jgi:hypothetical protein
VVSERAVMRAGAAALAIVLFACDDTVVDLVVDAGSGTDADTDADTDTSPDVVRAQIKVPWDFSATPARITSSFYSPASMPPGGPPDGVGASYDSPEITIPPAQPYEFWTLQPALEGQYYLVITLFVEGGGTDVPVPGVDWVGVSDSTVHLGPGTGTVLAGEIHLNLALPPL